MKAKPRMLAPSECNTEAKIRRLANSYVDTPRSWISVEGVMVTIYSNGHRVYVTLADMRKFARWFLRKQRCGK